MYFCLKFKKAYLETGNAIVGGTKRFAGATGTARLSGMVDLSGFFGIAGDPMTFDCLFVIDLD